MFLKIIMIYFIHAYLMIASYFQTYTIFVIHLYARLKKLFMHCSSDICMECTFFYMNYFLLTYYLEEYINKPVDIGTNQGRRNSLTFPSFSHWNLNGLNAHGLAKIPVIEVHIKKPLILYIISLSATFLGIHLFLLMINEINFKRILFVA